MRSREWALEAFWPSMEAGMAGANRRSIWQRVKAGRLLEAGGWERRPMGRSHELQEGKSGVDWEKKGMEARC
jgi:hypothetical protein